MAGLPVRAYIIYTRTQTLTRCMRVCARKLRTNILLLDVGKHQVDGRKVPIHVYCLKPVESEKNRSVS